MIHSQRRVDGAACHRFSTTRIFTTRGTDLPAPVSKRHMFEQANLGEPRYMLGDWILRGAIGVVFVIFGVEKFSSAPGSSWVGFFQQVGAGQWFRYFTSVVEVLGGVLVLIPWTTTAGLALLACTMASAVLILVFVLQRPADCIFAAGILIALVAFWRSRRA